MKITCPNCETKFAIGIDHLGPKGRKLKCSSCAHIWREFDKDTPAKPTETPAPKVAKAPEPKPEPEPAEDNDQGAIDDMFAAAPEEENDQGAIDDMFAAAPEEENDQGAIDDMFAAAPEEENDQGAIDDMFAAAPEEENDQGAIDDMFAAAPEEENDQSAVDDMFAAASDEEENDQGAIDDMFDTPSEADEENDQGAIDDMFDTPLTADNAEPSESTDNTESTKAAFEKALPSQSAVYKKQKTQKPKSNYIYWGALAAAATLIMGIFVVGKDTIINFFPKSAAAYALYGFETNVTGLEFLNKSATHQVHDNIDFLMVTGSIINNSSATKTLPNIRGYLIDRSGNNIFNWPIEVAKSSLAAGEIVSFESGIKDPAPAAQTVKFRFIDDKKLADN